jgi:large subunit ribosomal protein L32
MGVPKKRKSKSRRDRRRAAVNTLKSAVQVNTCSNCGAAVQPHHVCPACGYYKAKKVAAGSAD